MEPEEIEPEEIATEETAGEAAPDSQPEPPVDVLARELVVDSLRRGDRALSGVDRKRATALQLELRQCMCTLLCELVGAPPYGEEAPGEDTEDNSDPGDEA